MQKKRKETGQGEMIHACVHKTIIFSRMDFHIIYQFYSKLCLIPNIES